MSLSKARSAAAFSCDSRGITLFASRGIDQSALEAIQAVWGRHRAAIEAGETFHVADRTRDARLAEEERDLGAASFAVVPVLEGERLVALLYVEGTQPSSFAPADLDRLRKLSRILARAVSAQPAERQQADWRDYLEHTPLASVEREKLLLLLNHNEWNIARVSRLMGLTRRTVYQRLARYKIARERVRKTRPRTVPA